MTSYFQGLVEFVGAHPQLSLLAVFLLALSEAVPVVGTVVPGSTLILAVSALATAAGMTPWALLIAAVAGAIVGDGFSFWLGHNYRRQILRGWPLNRFPWLVDRSAQLIRKYGIASVFLARFTAVVRAFVLLLAGILKMSTRHFYVANILSALVWAPLHVFPGVLVGLAVAFGAHSPALSLAALAALILAWIAWSMIKRKTASIVDHATAPESGTRDVRSAAEVPSGGKNAVPTRTEKTLPRCPLEPYQEEISMSMQSGSAAMTGKPLIESDRVEGTTVYDPQGKNIGSIKRLMIEKISGRVAYSVMSFGGFLGMGTEDHAIPWNKLTYDTRLGGYRTDITEQQLRGAPAFSRDRNYDWTDRSRERELHDHYGAPYYWGP